MKKCLIISVAVLSLDACVAITEYNCDGPMVKDEKMLRPCEFNANLVCDNGNVLANGIYHNDESQIYTLYKDGQWSMGLDYGQQTAPEIVYWKDVDIEHDVNGNLVGLDCTYLTSKNGHNLYLKLDTYDIQNLLYRNKGYALSCDYIKDKAVEVFNSKGIELHADDGYQKANKTLMKFGYETIKEEILNIL